MINWKRPTEELPDPDKELLVVVGSDIYFAFAIYLRDRNGNKIPSYYISDDGSLEGVDFWYYLEDLIKTLPGEND